MSRLILRRLAVLPLQVLGVVTIVFFLSRLMPGDPAFRLAGSQATAEQVAAIRHDLGLDQPIWAQYWRFLTHAVQGDFGRSLQTGNNVTTDLLQRAPATLALILLSLVVIIVLTLGLVGWFLARPRGVARRTIGGYGFLAGAVPDFWIGLALISLLYAQFGLGAAPSGQLDARMFVDNLTGVAFVDAMLAGDGAAMGNAALHLLLPVLTLAIVYTAPVVRIMSAVSTQTMQSDFMRFANSWGIKSWRRVAYVLHHGAPTLITALASTVVFLLGGAVLVETVFSWGGLGQYGVAAVTQSDYAAVQGFVIVAGTFTAVVYALGDVLHTVFDPKLRD
ncbi:ABC transporter permease [Planosporangium flavigriseum]|uniref:ABC transporter permease n=1 Tax=Planosporangium flavigriseum TaxID=373681 RepID=A0A8J3LPI3_9ACTN|nr:ABC transporter permease [Planosporangium flavigriseum]NJC66174.1 ABC transporter permease [Planosporangium flavigriseum]GIG75134.1 ABC transporter permease [Planosporangium flavigriseum]